MATAAHLLIPPQQTDARKVEKHPPKNAAESVVLLQAVPKQDASAMQTRATASLASKMRLQGDGNCVVVVAHSGR